MGSFRGGSVSCSRSTFRKLSWDGAPEIVLDGGFPCMSLSGRRSDILGCGAGRGWEWTRDRKMGATPFKYQDRSERIGYIFPLMFWHKPDSTRRQTHHQGVKTNFMIFARARCISIFERLEARTSMHPYVRLSFSLKDGNKLHLVCE
jgi:hypothetical protein